MNKKNRIFQIFFGVGMLVFYALSRVCYSESELFESSGSTSAGEEIMFFQEFSSVYDVSKYEQPVSSASKYDQQTTLAPSSVSVITADEIRKYGYRNFAEIVRSIRGFHTVYDRNYHYLGVRGFGIPGDYNSRILLLVDGHRVNDNIYDSAPIGTEFPLDIDLIDWIEIIRGPGSSLYGANAFFAVINVITRKGRNLKGFETSAEAGSFDTYKSRFSYGNRFQNGLEMILSGSYYASEGDDRLFFKEFDDPSTNNGMAEDLDYDRFHSFFSEVTYRNFTLQGDYHSRKKGVPTAPWETIFNEDLFIIDENAWVDLKYEQVYDNQLGVLSRVNYNYYNYEGDYPYFWGPPYPDSVINRDESKGQWLRGEVQLTKTLMDVHQGTFGMEYQYNLQQDQFNADEGIAGGVNLDDHRNTQFGGVYLQDEFHVIDHLTVNAGVRLDYYETFGATVNPRVSLIYNPCEKSAFKVIYGRAFRAPNAYELFFHDELKTQKANPHLDPETIDTYELVYEQYFGKHYRGTVNGFYNEIHDLITLTTDPADELLVFQNTDEVRAKGIEFEIEGKWPGGHEGTVGYTLQEAENKETGKTLVNSPEHLLKLNLIGSLLKEKVFLGVEEQYTSRRKTISDNVANAFFITNVTLSGRNIFKTLEVSGSVYNLFDKEYDDPASEEHLQDTIEQDGRTFRIKLTYAF